MSALTAAKAEDGIGLALLNATRPIFAKAIWSWFDETQDRVLFSKWGFINIRVRDFRMLVEEIAGPDPSISQ